MALFAQAGIYVMVDLMAPEDLSNASKPMWDIPLYDRFISVIDTMHNYTNLLGFILGDDVISGITLRETGPYLKAAVRDMKAYIRQKSYRPIPVGFVNSEYNSAKFSFQYPYLNPLDGQNFVYSNFVYSDYLLCGDKSDEHIDFWGANIRDWCLSDNNNYTHSSYANATSALSAYPVPGFVAAYGCEDPTDLDISEIDIIYGPLMSPVWSGAIYYEYFSQSFYGKHLFLR